MIQVLNSSIFKTVFLSSDTGAISSELNSIYQAAFMGFLGGACYGGFHKSRKAYLDFMDNNQATAFKSHFDAKVRISRRFCAVLTILYIRRKSFKIR